ncbi:MAG: hypothetical protein QOJ56_739 [Mycobacterium sp.]|jgi:hypothetical protein|nr:hypothetical protein [Mycobacterium sp.]MDT7766113.1 hypothetical protein [Mycobacterium sp.]
MLACKPGCLGPRCTAFGRASMHRFRVCAARDGCARFWSHLLSPHITSGVPAPAGVLMAEPIGAICR